MLQNRCELVSLRLLPASGYTVQTPSVRTDGIRQEVAGLQAAAINIQREHMSQAICFTGYVLPCPYQLLKKHFIGYNARSIMILFLLAFCFIWREHSSKALWLVAKEQGTILHYELVGGQSFWCHNLFFLLTHIA
jgi:hypothetical protein